MKKYYRICQQNIELSLERDALDAEEWALFETGCCEPDIVVACCEVASLPEREGEYKPSGDDFCVRDLSPCVERRFVAAGKDASLAQYKVSQNPQCSVAVTENMWDAIMDRRYMWPVCALPYLLAMKRTIMVHASYIEFGGEGIIFSAPCGTGKSTQAALWEKHRGAEIINGDKCAISADADGVTVHGVPFAGTSGICKNKSLPLKAIVVLRQAPQNSVKRLGGAYAVRALTENVYHDMATAAESAVLMSIIMDITEETPIYELACTPDEGAVQELEKLLRS